MRKNLLKILAVAIMGSLTISCMGYNTSLAGPNAEMQKLNDIILVEQYSNFAWGYQNSGTYVDRYGYLYTFDFGNDVLGGMRGLTKEEFLEELFNSNYYIGEPVAKIDEQQLNTIIKELGRVNPEASVTQESVACDAGQTTLYRVGADRRFLPLCSSGDIEEELQDNAAKKVKKIWDHMKLVELNKSNSLSEIQPIKIKNGRSNQVGGAVTLTETNNLQFKDGELTFKVLGLNEDDVLFDDVKVETTGKMKANIEKVTEGPLTTIKIKITDTSDEVESLTLHDFSLSSHHLLPEIAYGLLIEGDGIIYYGRNNIGLPDFIDLQKDKEDHPQSSYRDIAISPYPIECIGYDLMKNEDIVLQSKEESCIITDEGELMIPLDVIEQGYELGKDKVITKGDHITLILGKRKVELTIGSDEVVIDGEAHATMAAPVAKGEKGIVMVPARSMAILVSAEYLLPSYNSWYRFYNMFNVLD